MRSVEVRGRVPLTVMEIASSLERERDQGLLVSLVKGFTIKYELGPINRVEMAKLCIFLPVLHGLQGTNFCLSRHLLEESYFMFHND